MDPFPAKPIQQTEHPDENPDWVLYESGNYAHPLVIAPDYRMRQLFGKYVKRHPNAMGVLDLLKQYRSELLAAVAKETLGETGVKLATCTTCLSREIRQNSDSAQNPATGEWETVAYFDSFSCEVCGGECGVTDRLFRLGPYGDMLIADLDPEEWMDVTVAGKQRSDLPHNTTLEVDGDKEYFHLAIFDSKESQKWYDIQCVEGDRPRPVNVISTPKRWRPHWPSY